MSTLKTTNLQSSDASSANIILGQGSGGGATISGVTTSSTLRATTGIVTTATITTADVTTSRTTTGITTTATIDTATVGGVTTLNSDGVNSTGISTAKTFVPTEGQLANRNLMINGAMQVAQRGTSTTTSGGYAADRYRFTFAGTDEAPTMAQHALTSSDTGPWAAGFRYSTHITNGNQTGGAGSGDTVFMKYKIEAQDLAQSGWEYTSTSSYITLSFWVKASVAQNYYGYLLTEDGTNQTYPFETGSLTANTWTKIIKTIPGNSGITINNDNGTGLAIHLAAFVGTDQTASGVALNTWATFATGTRMPDNTSTWYTTNDATFEFTGVQLEVGSVATPFEHRSYGDELLRCQRYYEHSYNTGVAVGSNSNVGGYYASLTSDSGGNATWSLEYKVQKRAVPTMAFYRDNGTSGSWDFNGSSVSAGAHTVNAHRSSQTHLNAYLAVGANWIPAYVFGHWTSSSEL